MGSTSSSRLARASTPRTATSSLSAACASYCTTPDTARRTGLKTRTTASPSRSPILPSACVCSRRSCRRSLTRARLRECEFPYQGPWSCHRPSGRQPLLPSSPPSRRPCPRPLPPSRESQLRLRLLAQSHPQSSAPADGTLESAHWSSLSPEFVRTALPPADSPLDSSARPPTPPHSIRRTHLPQLRGASPSSRSHPPCVPARRHRSAKAFRSSHRCYRSNTLTLSPALNFSMPLGSTTNPFARAFAARSPEPCHGTGRTPTRFQSLSTIAGRNRVTRALPFTSSRSLASINCGAISVCPLSARNIGATNNRKQTSVDTGFPGRPKK